MGMRGKRAGRASAASGAALTSSTTASTSRWYSSRSTAPSVRHSRTLPAWRGYPRFTARRGSARG